MRLSVKKIVEICNGELYCGNSEIICTNLVKDTRIINDGDTYIGIKGEKYNGNDFYIEAFNKGANCVIIEKEYFKVNDDFQYDKPIILVKNSLDTLRVLATFIRNNSHAFFVGVTGSVGKTSTRDMIYSVLSEKFKTLKTEGNFNNNIGLPLTIMRLNDEEAAVIEMGMNHLHEIEYLSNITRPHISVITNVGTAHIGQLGSRGNILKAKLEITKGMDDKGLLIINNDNDLLHDYYEKNPRNIITVGINNQSDFMATNLKLNADSSNFDIRYNDKIFNIYCPIPGEAFVYNSLVAFAVATLLGVESAKIITGIKKFELTANRLEIIELKDNIKIINGVYNASVDSMKSNLEILKNQSGKRKIAVLGSMLELGDFTKSLHEAVGEFVVQSGIDILVTIGEYATYIAKKAMDMGMKKENIYILKSNSEAIQLLKDVIKENDTILLKASNSLNFKEILDAIVLYLK